MFLRNEFHEWGLTMVREEMRLFSVGGKFFSDKASAKAYRNEHGGHVSKGPDHDDYNVWRSPSIHPPKGKKK
jgi:hypothetical protein